MLRCLTPGLVLLALAGPARGETPDPLRLVPDAADFFVKVEKPRALAEGVARNELVRQLEQFPAVRELLDSTGSRRFAQLIAYYERDLGAAWPELLDRLAGGGVVVATKIGDKPPALLVVRSRDGDLLRRAVELVLKVTEEELARQDAKQTVERGNYRGVEGFKVGTDVFGAVVGDALLVANRKEALQLALDTHLDRSDKTLGHKTAPAQAKKLVGGDPLLWTYLDLEPVRALPGAKEAFARPRNDTIQTVFFGGLLDVTARSPFVASALHQEAKGYRLAVKMPRGRNGGGADIGLMAPPAGEPGTLPLLEPKGAFFSYSFYLDLAALWEKRAKLLNAKQVKDFEKADRDARPFMAGTSISKMLTQSGPYHRVVVTQSVPLGYAAQPAQKQPAFAFVTTQRDPQFARSLEAALRAAALFGGAQFKWKVAEEEHDGVKVVAYKFPEDKDLPQDAGNLRYNYSPSFAVVGDQIVIASRVEFARELIGLLKAEAAAGRKADSPATGRMRFSAEGAVEMAAATPDQLVTQAVLDQALPAGEAKEQVNAFLAWARKLGVFDVNTEYGANDYTIEFRWAWR